MPRHARRPLRYRLVFDRALGVSRRRRYAAYLAIATGLKLLQPALRRVAVATAVIVTAPIVVLAVS